MKHNKLEGRTIHFRLIEESDAVFLYQLRIDEKLNKYISKVDSSIEAQKEWVRNYKERERKNIEYYFVIERNDTNEKIGTIRLYGITDDKRFCWGSWILNSRKTVTSAIESAYLIYEFAFERCNLSSSYFQVDRLNSTVNSFHVKTGAIKVDEDIVNVNYVFTKECFLKFKNKFRRVV